MRPMHAVLDRELAPWQFGALLFSLLAALALAVAVIGLYALLAHQVAERTREIGIRMSLGASPEQIVRFFAFRTARVLAAALLAGLLICVAAGRSMNALLFGVTPTDPATYAIVCLFLLVAALVGAYWPIRRATAVDPIVALRQD
jgi:ABC-type antimicrobial peptide transport system permease subunit